MLGPLHHMHQFTECPTKALNCPVVQTMLAWVIAGTSRRRGNAL